MRKPQWAFHQKMIIVLNDEDLHQMTALKVTGDDPSIVIRQKIEDFRLSF